MAGLPKEQGEFGLARLSQVATEAKTQLAGERCTANFFIVVTPQPGLLLASRSPPLRLPALVGTSFGLNLRTANTPTVQVSNFVARRLSLHDHGVCTNEPGMNVHGFPWSLTLPAVVSDYWSHFAFLNAVLLGVVLGLVTTRPPRGKP